MGCTCLAWNQADLILWLTPIVLAGWVFAFGACVGSLLNVLVYRLPLGLDVVSPTSRCPSCETKLTWRENIPIFGWLMLRGRCRFCHSAISSEYPIVETCTALLWVAVWAVLYADNGRFLGIPVGAMTPEWAASGFRHTWPMFIAVLGLFSCLIAVTLIDARTFHIPMSLVVFPVVLGLACHAGWAAFHGPLHPAPRGWEWSLPTPGVHGWQWVGMALGGAVGLGISVALLRFGVIKRSFADYEQWLESHQASPEGATPESSPGGTPEADHAGDSPEMWVQYPHARREMIRELVFLGPCIGLAMLGAALALRLAGPWTPDMLTGEMLPGAQVPHWLSVLCGVLLGYLIGGGLVWAMRIFGSLAFGKEALGLGDVHLMAAVGACLGWIDATLGFFGAAFVGMVWAIVGKMASGKLQRHMPFGPYLAIATVLVWFTKPWIEHLMNLVAKVSPPINLP